MHRIRGASVRMGGLVLALVVLVGAWSLWPDVGEPAALAPLVATDAEHGEVRLHESHGEAVIDDAVSMPLLGDAEDSTQAAVPTTAARLDDEALWAELHATLQSMTDGSLSPEEVARLCADLLARIDESRATYSDDGQRKVYELLDAEGVGSATLTVSLDGGAQAARNHFALRAELVTAPGYYTGFPDDGVTTSQLSVHLELGDDRALEHCTTLAITDFVEGPTHFDEMFGRPPLGLGGWLSVRPEGAEYRPMTIQALRDDDGETIWRNTTGDPVACGAGDEVQRFDGVVATLRSTRR